MNLPYYIGAPFWSFNAWKKGFYSKGAAAGDFLEEYTSVFNTVEAGSTFYALPKRETVQKWRSQVNDSFRFVFKVPKLITHQLKLQNCQAELDAFLKLMEPVLDVTGMLHIQLSPGFSGRHFEALKSFLENLPQAAAWAVEVRHKDFFDEGQHENQLDELLLQHSITRIHFNTSALFDKEPTTPTLIESQSKKPRNPDRWSVTTPTPVIRFISCDDMRQSLIDANKLLQATAYWLEKGLTPYIMLHSPGNAETPQMCRAFHELLSRRVDLPEMKQFPCMVDFQPDLFEGF